MPKLRHRVLGIYGGVIRGAMQALVSRCSFGIGYCGTGFDRLWPYPDGVDGRWLGVWLADSCC
jgi:hypothetical protein